MQPNPVLRRLGLADNDRVVIIHTDDIGMCLPSVRAFSDLWEVGQISSGAVMMPCPWALKAVEYARAHPQADLGVHITLTSEWKTYRWGPISTRDPQSGMVDAEGCFYHSSALAGLHGDPQFVQREVETQVQRAKALGMVPTHMDTHMGAVANFKFIAGYLQVALAYRLPPMAFRLDEAGWMNEGLDAQTAQMAASMMGKMEEMGLPLLDHLERRMELDQPQHRLDLAKHILGQLKPGITHFIIHPCTDMPELAEITRDWQARVADYQTFMNEDIGKFIREQGIQVIGYRALQALMPDPAALAGLML